MLADCFDLLNNIDQGGVGLYALSLHLCNLCLQLLFRISDLIEALLLLGEALVAINHRRGELVFLFLEDVQSLLDHGVLLLL